jgi:hypothetical protein
VRINTGTAGAVKKWFPSPVWILIISLALGAISFDWMYDTTMESDDAEEACDEAGIQSLDCEIYLSVALGNAALSFGAVVLFWTTVSLSAFYGITFLIAMGSAGLIDSHNKSTANSNSTIGQVLDEEEQKPPF